MKTKCITSRFRFKAILQAKRLYVVYSGKPETEWYNKTGYIVKGGANYNIDEHHNVFFNTGVISRQPQFNALFLLIKMFIKMQK